MTFLCAVKDIAAILQFQGILKTEFYTSEILKLCLFLTWLFSEYKGLFLLRNVAVYRVFALLYL